MPRFLVSVNAQSALIKELTIEDGIYYYKGDKFNGLGFLKNKKGQFIAEVSFKKGKMHGNRICYNSRGRILSKDKFKSGKGRFKTYYSNAHIKSEGIVDNEIKVGLWKFYNARGGVKAKEFWSTNSLGFLMWEKYFNKLGGLESEVIYEDGEVKIENYYDESGNLFKSNKY
tara:strand:- start:1257 stop:1769 length:513 start_codon:yes stop_codon:yes gene_type:complete